MLQVAPLQYLSYSFQVTSTQPFNMSTSTWWCAASAAIFMTKMGSYPSSIEEDLKKVWDMGKDPGGVLLCHASPNFGGIMAVPTDPPYCLVYPMIYSEDVDIKNQNHFNTMASPQGLHTHGCICHTLLQHADLTEAHKQKYNGSHPIVPCSAQYKTLFPEITMPCNHQGPFINQQQEALLHGSCRRLQPSGQDIPWFSCVQSLVQWRGSHQT